MIVVNAPNTDILDHIYNSLDELLLSGKYREADVFLCEVDLNRLSATSQTLSILTITKPWKDQLPTRDSFFDDVKNKLVKENLETDLLQGLD